jgi:hypothetical protein
MLNVKVNNVKNVMYEILYNILFTIKKKIKNKYCIISYYMYVSFMDTWIGKHIFYTSSLYLWNKKVKKVKRIKLICTKCRQIII